MIKNIVIIIIIIIIIIIKSCLLRNINMISFFRKLRLSELGH